MSRNVNASSSGVCVLGEPQAVRAVEEAFSVLTGRTDGNTLSTIIEKGIDGHEYFVNDDSWWRYTDFQCNYHGTYGWRPFFDARHKRADLNTWRAGFQHSADEALVDKLRRAGERYIPPVGYLPASFRPLSDEIVTADCYFCNVALLDTPDPEDCPYGALGYNMLDRSGSHDLNCDYPLMNIITATDWMLWKRDLDVAKECVSIIEKHLEILLRKKRGDLLLIGRQGSQIEYGHGGGRYPASTHLYLLKVLTNLAEVYEMLGQHGSAEERRSAAADLYATSYIIAHNRRRTSLGWAHLSN